MFLQRALVTLIAGPLALYLIYLGSWYYFLPIAAVLIVATYEYCNLMRRLGWSPSFELLAGGGLLQWIAAQWPALEPLRLPALVLALLAGLLYGLWQYERHRSETAVADWLVMSSGAILLGWVGSHFFLIRGLDNFGHWAAIAMLSTWSADSGAYLIGRQFGRHKMSPRLSPNKTVEGYFGGIAFSALITLLGASIIDFSLAHAAVLVLLGGVVSPAGDLSISLLKRVAGVKDSGHLLPGHGGALDRIDSLVWAVTLGYYFAVLIR